MLFTRFGLRSLASKRPFKVSIAWDVHRTAPSFWTSEGPDANVAAERLFSAVSQTEAPCRPGLPSRRVPA